MQSSKKESAAALAASMRTSSGGDTQRAATQHGESHRGEAASSTPVTTSTSPVAVTGQECAQSQANDTPAQGCSESAKTVCREDTDNSLDHDEGHHSDSDSGHDSDIGGADLDSLSSSEAHCDSGISMSECSPGHQDGVDGIVTATHFPSLPTSGYGESYASWQSRMRKTPSSASLASGIGGSKSSSSKAY